MSQMRWDLMATMVWASALGGFAAAQPVQVPGEIKAQVLAIQDRFLTVLDEECKEGECFPVGCQVGRFETLDETQTSSLPGLDEPPPAGKPQYRLQTVTCEFTYEPTVAEGELKALRQRLRERVRQVGVTVDVRGRALADRPEEPKPTPPPTIDLAEKPWQDSLWLALLPFLPWLVTAIVVTVLILLLVWGLRSLGRAATAGASESSPAPNANEPPASQPPALAEPTPHMLMTRIAQLKAELLADPKLAEHSLKKVVDEQDYAELGRFLKHFGPEPLAVFKEKSEHAATLTELGVRYGTMTIDDRPGETWAFLTRLERAMTAAKVRMDHEPLDAEFAFLGHLEIDEFLGILREVSEAEAIAAIAYAPQSLREKFFAEANPSFTAKFIEQLTHVEKLADPFVRQTAQKLRRIYTDQGGRFKTIKVDRMPLLEEALNALGPERRKKLVGDLGRAHPELISTLAPAIFLDDALPHLPDETLTELFLNLTPSEAAAYLSHFPWGSDILMRIKPRLAEVIRASQSVQTSEDLELSQAARTKIVSFVKEKDHAGAIDLKTINGQLIGQ